MASSVQSNTVRDFLDALFRSRKIVAITGAGLSAASGLGIPPFRGAGGVWEKYDLSTLATPQAFEDNPIPSLTLVTQNIDGLCEKAVQEVLQHRTSASGNDSVSPLFEMHGRLSDTRCTSCGREDLPHCRICDGSLRPGVVWFEESPRHLRGIWDAVDQADMCLVIGTSSTPAAGFAYEVSQHGGKVAVFNVNRS
ncbi:sirtuin 5 [Armillaria borealis]|uniref:Sirtuin 5 n=1 Tax=Armillaria borealis TaxID=47425 RepID=A0AA39JXZ4_9AGAR|nr:sirtuin 5 [Armillaria borealis]